jgi:hypothetical protein
VDGDYYGEMNPAKTSRMLKRIRQRHSNQEVKE